MALDKTKLEADIKTLAKDVLENNKTSDDFAKGLANLIDAYVRSQTITVSGVVTAGTAFSQTQTAPVTAIIS